MGLIDKESVEKCIYKIGQIVKFSRLDYEIIDISAEPYMTFDDGSKHYVMAIKLCGGTPDDVVYINDAQLDKALQTESEDN